MSVGQWCRMSFQVRADGGSWPSIGSVAEPLNEMTSPTFQRVPAAGEVIVALGPPDADENRHLVGAERRLGRR